MKHSLIKALCSLTLITSLSGVGYGADVYSFETALSKDFQAQVKLGMTVSVSDKQAVLGKKSLRLAWSEEGGSVTIPVSITTDNQLIDNRRHAAVFSTWIYQDTALSGQKLSVEFGVDKQTKPQCSFIYQLGHQGWRTVFYPFNRMEGKHGGKLNWIRITAPEGKAGEAYLDLLVPSVQYDRRHASEDESYQFTKDDEHSRIRKGEPIDIYHQGFRKIATTPITEEQKKSIKALEATMQRSIVGSKKKSNLEALTKQFNTYDIEQGGKHIFFLHTTDLYKGLSIEKGIKKQLKFDIKATGDFLLKLTQAWYHADDLEEKSSLEDMIISMHKLLLKSGWNKGHAHGTMHHFGYNSRGYYRASFIARELLENHQLREPVAAALQWFNDALYCYEKGAPQHYANLDYYNTLALEQLFAILMTKDDSQRYQATVQWTKTLSQSIALKTHSIEGGFKEDGSAYHHWGHYPAYQVGAMSSIAKLFYHFHDTPFRLTPEAYRNYENSLLGMRIWSNKYNFPRALSGRHPMPRDGQFGLPAVKDAFIKFALSGSADGKQTLNQKVAAAALRLYPDAASKFPNSITPETTPSGHWSFPYAATSAHRRGEWLAVARGHSKNVWASEIYGAVNLYGRYQSHGTLEILPNGGLAASGVNELGWDWSRPPGSTVTYLPTEQIPFDSVVMMSTSLTNYAATVHSDNENGLFALQLAEKTEPNRTEFGLRARKSYSFFDNVIVCLGSDIHGPSPDHPVQTNLFQQFLKTADTPTAINDKVITALPWKEQLNSPALLKDAVGHYYYVPQKEKGQNLNLSRSTQHSRYHYPTMKTRPKSVARAKQNPATQADYACAWIDHGIQPNGASYEYAVIVYPSADQVKDWKPSYQIIQHDADAHIVKSGDTECFSLFTGKSIKHDFIASVSAPCAIITKQVGKQIKLNLTDPDLRFPGDNGGDLHGEIHLAPSDIPEEAKLTIILKGNYQSNSPGLRLKQSNNTTELTFTTKRGRTLECLLTPASR